jgi:hypothetical protein
MSERFPNEPSGAPRQGGADDGQAADAPEYSFDGYTIAVSQKVALRPIAEHHRAHGHGREHRGEQANR